MNDAASKLFDTSKQSYGENDDLDVYKSHADSSELIMTASEEQSVEYDSDDSAPLALSYIFGINRKLGVCILNKSPNEHFCIYSLGHVASLINFNTKVVHHFQGHDTILVSIEHDEKAKFVATADKETIIIWDLGKLGEDMPIRLRYIYRPFGKDAEIAATGMSPCGKYIVVGSGKTDLGTFIKFWRWSFAVDECDAEFTISDKFGRIVSIKFSKNANENEFFVITLRYGVVFAWWDRQSGQLEVHTPEQKKFGILNQSCYVPGKRTVASVTNHGRIVIWADTLINLGNQTFTNRKNFVKMVSAQSQYPINDIKAFDGMLATCNETGEIRFYDTEIRLLYVCTLWKDSPVDMIQPVLVPKTIKLIDADDFDVEESDDIQIVYKSTCPRDYTLEKKPFLVREFFVVARTGDVLYCNIFKKDAKSMLYQTSDSLVAYDALKNRPWVICANSDRKIFYLDYTCYHIIREQRMKEYTAQDEEADKLINPSISCIRISEDGNHLAIGYDNGAVWMIDPLILNPLTPSPIRYSSAPIQYIVFSGHPSCIYADTNATITHLRYNKTTSEWTLNAKYRYHHRPLVLLHVIQNPAEKPYLIALGEERLYVEFDLDKSVRKSKLEIKRDRILEQAGNFTCAEVMKLSKIVSKDTSTNGMVILVADDQYKFKIFDVITMERLYMFAAPVYDAPVRVIVNFSDVHKFYHKMLIFATEKTLGCIVLPIDGNMFRYSGITAHPKKINMLIPYGSQWFASSQGDLGGAVWTINERNVMRHFKSGGEGLTPFCKSIPGEKEGWLFKEMQDMFYYMQLMTRGGDAPEEHAVTDFVPVEDLPDYMRSIGFFPSDYEIECILKEATRTTSPSIPPPTTISFEDAVIMYLNHKPVSGYELQDIRAAVEYLADQHSSDYITTEKVLEGDESQITLARILEIMTSRGEPVSEEMAKRYLLELLSEESGKMKKAKLDFESEFEELPEIFTVKEFCSELLGIDLKDIPGANMEASMGDKLDPAEVNSQLENRFNIIVPESDIDVDKERDKEERKSLLKQGRVINVTTEN